MARKKSAPRKKPESTIYIGRSLPNGTLPQYTVFNHGEIPLHLVELVQTRPAIRGLIVPVSELQRSRAEAQKQGTLLHKYFMEV